MIYELILSKQKLIIRNRIVSTGYVMTDETVNYIIKEFSKAIQKKYKSKHDWVGKVIHWLHFGLVWFGLVGVLGFMAYQPL